MRIALITLTAAALSFFRYFMARFFGGFIFDPVFQRTEPAETPNPIW